MIAAQAPGPAPVRTYKYYDLIMASFVAVLLCSNLIGVTKIATVAGFTFGAGNLFFPISYLFGDVLTEVYGYARSRKVVWAGFSALAYASLMAWVVVHLPPAAGWTGQATLEASFGNTWRIAGSGLLGYACGEFTNSFTIAKLKLLTEGRFLFVRTIGSTVVGEAVDTLVFYPLAFYGVWSNAQLVAVMGANYVVKVLWEVFATPLTYRVVAFLKRKENEDYYDRDTNFTPFSLKT